MGFNGQSAKRTSEQWNQGFDAVGYSGRKWAKGAGLSYESSALPLSYSGMSDFFCKKSQTDTIRLALQLSPVLSPYAQHIFPVIPTTNGMPSAAFVHKLGDNFSALPERTDVNILGSPKTGRQVVSTVVSTFHPVVSGCLVDS